MKKASLAIAVAVIITVLALATLYIAFPNLQNNQPALPPGSAPQWQISVTGDFKEEKTWTLNQLTQMPLSIVAVTDENATYLGVSLYDFCNQTGINWDAGNLTVTGADGKTAELNIFQAYNSTSYPLNQDTNRIVLAFARMGEWLTNETGGPVRLITPSFGGDFQVEQVTGVHCEPWNLVFSGNVAKVLVMDGRAMASFQSKTLRGDFRPGNEPNRTSDWTGIPLPELLKAAGAPDNAMQVSVVGIDGYTKNFTLTQVSEGEMMIGYQENGQALPVSQGGPFRLFTPTDTYKWGVNWVKYVKEVIVT